MRVAVLLMMVLATGAASAQQMYRCGNTYSQTPCAADAVAKKVPTDIAAAKGPGLTGYELCADAARRYVNSPEPESARVQAAGARRAEVISYSGQPVATHRYELSVEAKNEAGMYTRPRLYACWLSEDQRRVLQFGAARAQ